jgi:methylated-DNA-[protein]-cysteine S-methyltransferase
MVTLIDRSEVILTAVIPTPIGECVASATQSGLCGFAFADKAGSGDCERGENDILQETRAQLEAYFAGALHEFDLPLDCRGTEFQQRVWRELCAIPYGTTISYGELAKRVGNPNASRAVGAANGKNTIVIIVPCHRVIASDGTLHGFGGGLWRKEFLLEHERNCATQKDTRNG